MAEAAADTPHPRILRPLALHAAAIVGPLTVLLFRRPEIAAHLDLLGAIVGESLLAGLIALGSAWFMVRTRNALPAGLLLFLGTVTAAVGVALMAWTIQLNLFAVGLFLYAIGSGPALVLHRVLLTNAAEPTIRHRTMSWYWAAASVGVGWPLGLAILVDVNHRTVLWIVFGLLIAAALLLAPQALVHDDDIETEPTAALLDTPWPRRSYWAAFGVGMVVLGGAQPALRILVDEWQRSPRQTAAVLGVGVLASAGINAFGPWYHRLDRLTGSRRSDAVGLQLLVAGTLVFIGALSFTYIGLIACWMVAGGAIGLAAPSLDGAVFPSVAPRQRRPVAFRQVVYLAAGAGTGLIVVSLLDAADEQWQLAVLGVPLVVIGWAVRRYADSARDEAREGIGAASAQVPRRVSGLDGGPTPVLEVDALDVAYGSVQVLFDVALRVDPGQVVALLGTNGAGKTTLLRAISGLEPVLAGRIVYAGLDITKTRPTWRVGMGLHQIVGGEAVVGPLTVDENLRMFCHDVAVAEGDPDPLAEVFGVFPILEDRRQQRAETLSGGEKQMLALAKALIVKPRLLLIDEFSLGLAPVIVAELLPVIRTIADRGTSVLLVEQSVNIALSIADHAYVMEKGEIGYEGPADELRSKPDLIRSAYLEGLSRALQS